MHTKFAEALYQSQGMIYFMKMCQVDVAKIEFKSTILMSFERYGRQRVVSMMPTQCEGEATGLQTPKEYHHTIFHILSLYMLEIIPTIFF